MIITIKGTEIELTDALKQYVEDKFGGLTKYFDNITRAEVDIGLRTHHHKNGKIYYAEVNLHVPRKILRVVKDAEDLYKAINKVKDHLKVELDTMKEKMRTKNKKEIRSQKEYGL
ncbi:MAG: ribosomal subunit interface protein [Candidatus Magasanikbacteria bacterium RIFCSPHIGHO2_02_FULL_47_14]|uniref:Ribosomal subunit interface protein n=1 Tax=Candidatus Magasanikbacteria bacterium RIFCSPHIGHO2_02_FULL_47_14 TaxID=1798680 RepID=A0A1F6M3Z3_9BACT|nr:MAG: ribosomal subunit interface protein [Candidatus Magasanikbacteria bacterium RIFCSPHIGHO2_02_FULL_47_14]